MSESSGKRRKSYVYHSKGIYKPSCLIHGPRNSSDECNVLGGSGYNYSKTRPTKDRVHDPGTMNKFNRQQENNAIVNHVVDRIFLQENNKVSSGVEANGNIEYEINKIYLYQIDNMIVDEKK